jgi:hypothetical protein
MMLSDIHYSKQGDIGWLYYIGFTLAQGIHINTFALSTITLAKLCGENTRGQMYGLNSFLGSIAILLIQFFVGTLYDQVSHILPFFIIVLAYVLLTLLLILFSLFGKLKA